MGEGICCYSGLPLYLGRSTMRCGEGSEGSATRASSSPCSLSSTRRRPASFALPACNAVVVLATVGGI